MPSGGDFTLSSCSDEVFTFPFMLYVELQRYDNKLISCQLLY